MKTLAHISDLHFGQTDNLVVSGMQAFLKSMRPDILIVSGDLTQRAREKEFFDAQKFLNNFDCKKIIVPGNHDVPLYNLWRRFRDPQKRFKRFINQEPEPFYVDAEVAVIGLNTSRSLVFKGGRVSSEQLKYVRQKIATLPPNLLKIVVSHHPLKEMRNKKILGSLIEAGGDVFLSGHLHTSSSEKIAYTEKHYAILVHAGTATSLRYRGETNMFNLLTISPTSILIDRYSWLPEQNTFSKIHSETYDRPTRGVK